MGLDRRFWRDKKVFLSGHTGFKGSWLSAWLHGLGARVHGYALDPPTQPSLFELASLGDGMQDQRDDVRDADRLGRALEDSGAEVVIHMAAQSLVRESYRDPAGTYATNVLGTVNLLDAVQGCRQVRSVLVVTSDKCYANDESGRAFTESDTLGGSDPYSGSKACQELVTTAYAAPLAAAGVAVATARSGNVIGGGDWADDRLVPDAVRAFSTGEALRVRYPAAVRPWQHVLDPLAGYLLLLEGLCREGNAFAGAWNFGPDDTDMKLVGEVADEFTAMWGDGAAWTREPDAQPPEAGLLRLDSSKARTALNWRSRMSLADSLAWTFEWYARWRDGGDLRAVTDAQIEAYESAMEVSP